MRVKRTYPTIVGWTTELANKRIKEENKSGSFGRGTVIPRIANPDDVAAATGQNVEAPIGAEPTVNVPPSSVDRVAGILQKLASTVREFGEAMAEIGKQGAPVNVMRKTFSSISNMLNVASTMEALSTPTASRLDGIFYCSETFTTANVEAPIGAEPTVNVPPSSVDRVAGILQKLASTVGEYGEAMAEIGKQGALVNVMRKTFSSISNMLNVASTMEAPSTPTASRLDDIFYCSETFTTALQLDPTEEWMKCLPMEKKKENFYQRMTYEIERLQNLDITDVDLIFFPVLRHGYYFLVCINIKASKVEIIDNKDLILGVTKKDTYGNCTNLLMIHQCVTVADLLSPPSMNSILDKLMEYKLKKTMEKNCDEQSEKNSNQQSEKNSDEQSEKNCDKELVKDCVEELEKNCVEELEKNCDEEVLRGRIQLR
nr:uncharacterized protein LOC109191246 [Ipomoea batatas]